MTSIQTDVDTVNNNILDTLPSIGDVSGITLGSLTTSTVGYEYKGFNLAKFRSGSSLGSEQYTFEYPYEEKLSGFNDSRIVWQTALDITGSCLVNYFKLKLQGADSDSSSYYPMMYSLLKITIDGKVYRFMSTYEYTPIEFSFITPPNHDLTIFDLYYSYNLDSNKITLPEEVVYERNNEPDFKYGEFKSSTPLLIKNGIKVEWAIGINDYNSSYGHDGGVNFQIVYKLI